MPDSQAYRIGKQKPSPPVHMEMVGNQLLPHGMVCDSAVRVIMSRDRVLIRSNGALNARTLGRADGWTV